MTQSIQSARLLPGATDQYQARLAAGPEELRKAQALRFAVFNLELHEGLADSFKRGLDEDPFDAVCDHLLVEHTPTGAVVGTYRLQTGASALAHLGYYSAQEFDLRPFDGFRGELIELGRACVDRMHRNLVVLGMLWKGIADYATERGGRYLFGCSSLTSQDPGVGARAFSDLSQTCLAPPEWRTDPLPACRCPMDEPSAAPVKVPKLLRAYLSIGARICGPPALDREFKTIDFLTVLDLAQIPAEVRARFLSGGG